MADAAYARSDLPAPAIIGRTQSVGLRLAKFQSMKTERLDFDRKCQLVSDYILPRRDFSIINRPNLLRPHRVTSSVATNANSRAAAFHLAYMIDPTRPNLLPSVKRGLAMAGRVTDLDDDAMDYLGDLSWSVMDHMMLPRAQLMLRLGSMLKEFWAFGNGVIWTGRKRGFGPYYNTRPFHACWWSENERGEIDTLYFKMLLPLYRVFQRYPAARAVPGWENGAKHDDEQELTSIILACQPRDGGRAGAVVEAKPFEFVAIAEDKGVILEESGYDSFPYSVFRSDPMPGQTYAEGAGCQVLPDVMVLNHLVQCIEDVAEQKARPALAWPARMFGKPLDRRPGAANAYNPSGLGLQDANKAIIKLDFTGDINEAKELVQMLTASIEKGYFVDWMNLRESGDMTAEEVSERRDIRLRGMSSIVANCELPMTVLGDRTMEGLAEERMLPSPVPASIAGGEVDWEYAGPLAVAQLRGNVQAALQLINAASLVKGLDPGAAEAVDLEECLRVVQQGLATPEATMNSRAKVAAAKAAAAKAQMQAQNAQKLQQVAAAANDGAHAASTVQGMQQGQGGPQAGGAAPGGASPFAPASPLSTPLAA